jgi:hypothetical protein
MSPRSPIAPFRAPLVSCRGAIATAHRSDRAPVAVARQSKNHARSGFTVCPRSAEDETIPVFVKAFTVRGDETLAPHEVELRVGRGTKDGIREGVAITRALTPVETDYVHYLAPLPPLTNHPFHFPILTFDVVADSQPFPPLDGQRFLDDGPCSSDGSRRMGKNPFEIITEKPCLTARDDPYFGRGRLLFELADAVCKSALEAPSRVPGAQCTLGLDENAHHSFAEQNFEKQYDQLRRGGGPGPVAPVPPRSGEPAEVPIAPPVP